MANIDYDRSPEGYLEHQKIARWYDRITRGLELLILGAGVAADYIYTGHIGTGTALGAGVSGSLELLSRVARPILVGSEPKTPYEE